MRIFTSRRAAGLAIALGAAGVAYLTLRQVVPTAETLLADTGPIVPFPPPKPNAYRDADGRSLVAVTTTPNAAAGVHRVVELLGGLDRLDLAGKRVLIKPNANSGYPAPASTSPAVLEAIIQLVQDHGAREVVVGEMSGPPWHDTLQEMTRNGLLDVIENNAASFVDFRYDEWVTIPLGNRSLAVESVSIARSVYEADVLIGLPTLKAHFLAGYSGAIKLWFGAVHPKHRLAAHATRDLGHVLADLCLPFQPDLLILDGGQAMITGGPKKGEVVRTNVYVASGDPVALDASAVAMLAGFGAWPKVREFGVWEQPQIQQAIALDLGVPNADGIALVADPDPDDPTALEARLRALHEHAGISGDLLREAHGSV